MFCDEDFLILLLMMFFERKKVRVVLIFNYLSL